VRLRGPRRVGGVGSPGRGGRLVVLPQPALQGTFAGQRAAGLGLEQPDADVAGAPARVLLAQGQDLVADRVVLGGPSRAGGIVGRQAVRVLAAAAQQVADGAHRQAPALGELGGGSAALGLGE
jgi:hypothetical protein